MATYEADPLGSAQVSSSNYVTDQDEQARKRTAIGLSPHRPTAPASVQRPPETGSSFWRWWLVVCMALLVVAISLLLLAQRWAGSSVESWWPFKLVSTTPGSSAVKLPPYVTVPAGYSLWFDQGFDAPNAQTPSFAIPGQVSAKVLPENGVLRMEVAPDQLGWVVYDTAQLTAKRIETGATVDAAAPSGLAGLVGRYQDPRNFYLFTVDGEGRLGVQLIADGRQEVLLPSRRSPLIKPAGQPNRLALFDDGKHLRFLVNQAPLYEVADPKLTGGRSGIAAGSAADQATVDFDWVAIYNLK